MVAHAYKSFSYQSLWQHYAVNWITGAYLELLKIGEGRMRYQRTGNKADLMVFERFSIKRIEWNIASLLEALS